MVTVPRFAVPAVFALAAALHAQTAFFPLKDIKPGMHGIGKTVFSGNRIDEFQVEVLGVLENIGPKQNLILARLSGGPLAETGVLQGMSGSPVYIDGKLAGAVALALPFAKEAITGIRPIEEMVRVTEAGRTPPPSQVARNTAHTRVSLASLFAAKDLTRLLPGRLEPRTATAATSQTAGHRHARLLRRIHPRHSGSLRSPASRPGSGTRPGPFRGRPFQPPHGRSLHAQARLHDQRAS